ncbi:MAG: 16S rRNA (uracil(1498)-N(3))-methyltransferase [Acetobacteraceae bacterium]|nr:16S rRNA (uracil(1498)-N(3))-methyltransferase [Acetobacteraceae bacterium]
MAGSIRLFVEEALGAGGTVEVGGGQAHYLAKVMRQPVGAPIRLFNGRDGEWLSCIVELGRGRARLELTGQTRPQIAHSGPILAFALLKRDATDLVVQKATELGATAIMPVFTERSVPGRINRDRLAAIAREAAEQSERLEVPAVLDAQHLPGFLANWPENRPLYACVERADGRFIPSAGGEPAGLLVGPEGGFAPRELDALRFRPFVVPVSLGPRILRAETAALAGLALLQAPACR